MTTKTRIDILMHQRGLAPSREKARAMIMAGEITVSGQLIDKPGTKIPDDAEIVVRSKPRFVSRGGEKLAGALHDFAYNVNGKVCVDVGASTGGFTDCLLQHDAAKVYAIDVGYGQLDYTIRSNPRVVVMERTNARYVADLPEPIELVVIDASFISLKLLLPVIQGWIVADGDIIALIKPQFEAGKQDVGKGGVVRDRQIHKRVIHDILEFATQQKFGVMGLTLSPLKGPAGNIEFLVWLRNNHTTDFDTLDAMIETVIKNSSGF